MNKKLEKYFLLNGKKILLIFLGFIVAIILHNLIYGLFKVYFDAHGGDEPFFFIIAVILIPIYFLICFIYTLIKKIKDKSIIKLGFIIRLVMSLILGVVFSYLIVEFTFINPMGFWILSLVCVFIVYYLSKLIY